MTASTPGNDQTLTVFGLEDTTDELAPSIRGADARYRRRAISVKELSVRFNDFVEGMQDVVGGMPASVAGLRVDEISFTAEISARGSVSLLGTGGEVAGQGGITVTLRRLPAESEQEPKHST